MATTRSIQMQYYNGTDYDTLYPITNKVQATQSSNLSSDQILIVNSSGIIKKIKFDNLNTGSTIKLQRNKEITTEGKNSILFSGTGNYLLYLYGEFVKSGNEDAKDLWILNDTMTNVGRTRNFYGINNTSISINNVNGNPRVTISNLQGDTDAVFSLVSYQS